MENELVQPKVFLLKKKLALAPCPHALDARTDMVRELE